MKNILIENNYLLLYDISRILFKIREDLFMDEKKYKDEKKVKAMLNEIKNMNAKQLDQVIKEIKELRKEMNALVGEKKNDQI